VEHRDPSNQSASTEGLDLDAERPGSAAELPIDGEERLRRGGRDRHVERVRRRHRNVEA
jgi:hypothetical protein